MLGFCDPMPAHPPRLDRAEAGMDVWLIGQEDGTDLAGSRVAGHHLGGRPAAIDFDVARRVVAHATRLADAAPVLHDVSAGGLMVAIAEICILSQVGVTLEECDAALMLDEAPSRLVAVTPVGFDLKIDDVPTRHLGVVGGDWIDQGPNHLMSVAEATAVWRDAIPRRMAP